MSKYYIQHIVLQTNYKNRFSIFKYIFTVLNIYHTGHSNGEGTSLSFIVGVDKVQFVCLATVVFCVVSCSLICVCLCVCVSRDCQICQHVHGNNYQDAQFLSIDSYRQRKKV